MEVVVAILDIWSERFELILPTKFRVIWISIQERKLKIDFQASRHGGHLGLPIGMILAIFIYKSPWHFLTSFESAGLSVQEKKLKIDF